MTSLLIHDHMHSNSDYVVDGTRIVCNPNGYQPGFQLAKAGVMLLALQSDAVPQRELALEDESGPDGSKLMSALDGMNQRFGRGTVLLASA